MKTMITMRRKEMVSPNFNNKGDFLTMLLENEFFKGEDDYIIDECMTFMGAGI